MPERGEFVRFFSRKQTSPGRLRRFSNRDFREVLLSGFYLGVAAMLPVGWWPPICAWVSRRRLKRHMRKGFPRYAAATRAVLGESIDAEKLYKGLLAANHRRRLLLAAHLAAKGWTPTIRLEGGEGLQAALKRGRGAIIWCDQFTAQTIIGKRALHEAGIEAHQVSVNFHGITDTKFGLYVLNPPLVAVENRFLKSRVVFERGDAYQVTVRMQKILKGNGIVLMTNNIHAGSAFTEAGLGESGWTHLASAPANFAARGRHGAVCHVDLRNDPILRIPGRDKPRTVAGGARGGVPSPGDQGDRGKETWRCRRTTFCSSATACLRRWNFIPSR